MTPPTQHDDRRDRGRREQTIASGTAALLSARVVSAAVVLVTSPVLLAELGTRGFGVWALLAGIVGAAVLADLGFGSAAVREVARTCGENSRRARAALTLVLVVNVAVGAALLALVGLGWPLLAGVFHLDDGVSGARDAAYLVVLALLVDAATSPGRAALEGSRAMRPLAAASAANALVGGGLGVGLVTLGGGLRGLGLAMLAGSLVRAALVVAAARRWAPQMRPSLSALRRGELRGLLGYGARVQLTSAATALNVDADRLVLGAFFLPAVVAPFDLGSKLVGALRLAPWQALTALFPAAAALTAAGERARLDHLYLRATRYVGVCAALTAAVLVASAGPLVEFWLGRPLPFAVTTIVLLAPAYALALTTGPAAVVMRAAGSPGLETRFALLAAAVNVVLTVPLLLALGPVGVPLASATAWTLSSLWFFRTFHRATARPLARLADTLWKPFAAGTAAASLTWGALGMLPEASGRIGAGAEAGLRATLVLTLAVVALLLLRFVDEDDRALVRRVLARVRPSRPVSPSPSLRAERT